MLFLTPNQQCHSRYSYSLTTFAILVASWFMDLLMHCMALYFRAKCPQRILRTTTFHCFCSSVCRLFVTLKTAAIFLLVYRGFREKLDHQSVVVFPEEKSQPRNSCLSVPFPLAPFKHYATLTCIAHLRLTSNLCQNSSVLSLLHRLTT